MLHKVTKLGLVMVAILIAIALVSMLDIYHLPAAASLAAQSVLFSDDFSGNLSQWDIEVGTWHIDQGELIGQGIGAGVDGWIYAGNTSWTDYALQAKISFINPNAILVLRSTGHWVNEYRFDFWKQGGQYSNSYQVTKYQDGISYDLTNGLVESLVPITDPCVLMVQVSGNHLILYANGEFIDQIDDPDPLSNGRIGLGVIWTDSARFDDVVVTTLPPVMILPPVEKEKYARAGETITYTVGIENHTGTTDRFNLQVLSGATWTTTLSADTVGPIADGAGITFTAAVEVPMAAQPGEGDSAIIRASSEASPGLTGSVTLNTFVTSGRLAYVPMSSTDELALIDTVLHTTVGVIDLAQVGCENPRIAKLTPDGQELYVTCEGSLNLVVLETTHFSLVATLDEPKRTEMDVAFVQNGAYALTSGSPYMNDALPIYVIDTSTYTYVQSIPVEDYTIVDLSVHPSLPLAYASGQDRSTPSSPGAVVVINTNTFTVQSVIPYTGYVWDAHPSPDGKWLYITGDDHNNSLVKIDLNTNQVVDNLGRPGKDKFSISPDGSRLYVSEGFDYLIRIIDADSLEYLTNFGYYHSAENALTCDGRELYIADGNAVSVPVIDTQALTVTHNIPIPGHSADRGIAICSEYFNDLFSRMRVDQMQAPSGTQLNYSLTASNISTHTLESVLITDTLPVTLTYEAGSLSAPSGSYGFANGVITWTGSINPSEVVTISFGAKLPAIISPGNTITNEAILQADGRSYRRSAWTEVIYHHVYMPCTTKPCPPLFRDDFSNPNSGWPIEAGTDYFMGYQDGEYEIQINPGWIAWAVQDFGETDYRVEVDARPIYGLDGELGIIFGANEGGFYLFSVSDGWYSLWRVDTYEWTWSPLIDWTSSPILHPGYATNRLRVDRVGDYIYLYANGQSLGSTWDYPYHGTWVGLASGAYSSLFGGRFDDFLIYAGSCRPGKASIGAISYPTAFEAIKSEFVPGEPLR